MLVKEQEPALDEALGAIRLLLQQGVAEAIDAGSVSNEEGRECGVKGAHEHFRREDVLELLELGLMGVQPQEGVLLTCKLPEESGVMCKIRKKIALLHL